MAKKNAATGVAGRPEIPMRDESTLDLQPDVKRESEPVPQSTASEQEAAASVAGVDDATATATPAADKPPEEKPRNGTPGKRIEGVCCPRCRDSRVSVKRGTEWRTEGVTRYRTCDGCGHRFTTYAPWIPANKPGENATAGKEDVVG